VPTIGAAVGLTALQPAHPLADGGLARVRVESRVGEPVITRRAAVKVASLDLNLRRHCRGCGAMVDWFRTFGDRIRLGRDLKDSGGTT
jgi:hypothetical protein